MFFVNRFPRRRQGYQTVLRPRRGRHARGEHDRRVHRRWRRHPTRERHAPEGDPGRHQRPQHRAQTRSRGQDGTSRRDLRGAGQERRGWVRHRTVTLGGTEAGAAGVHGDDRDAVQRAAREQGAR